MEKEILQIKNYLSYKEKNRNNIKNIINKFALIIFIIIIIILIKTIIYFKFILNKYNKIINNNIKFNNSVKENSFKRNDYISKIKYKNDIKYIYNILRLYIENRTEFYIKSRGKFLKRVGVNYNDSNVTTIQEKINWLTIHENPEYKANIVDKILLHEYSKKILGKDICVPILKIYNSSKEIDLNELPDKFVLKCNHGSAMNILCNNKSKLNIKEAKKT